jgi:hypothetical protein
LQLCIPGLNQTNTKGLSFILVFSMTIAMSSFIVHGQQAERYTISMDAPVMVNFTKLADFESAHPLKQVQREIEQGEDTRHFPLKYMSASTYLVTIYGYAGKYNATKCYDLRVAVASTAYAPIINDIPNITPSLKLYSVPVHDYLGIDITSIAGSHAQINIYDVLGKNVTVQNVALRQGLDSLILSTSGFSREIYILEVSADGFLSREKFMISK